MRQAMWRGLAPLLVTLVCAVAANGLRADTFRIDNTGDGPGDCAVAGQCTLRAAFAAANGTAGADTIHLTQGETYLLTQGSILAEGQVAVRVLDPADQIVASPLDTAIDAGGLSRHFVVQWELGSLGELDIRGVTIRNGYSDNSGGAIFVDYSGKLFLTDVILTGNKSGAGGALGVNALGEVTLTRVLVGGNVAKGVGGGIWNRGGTLTLADVTVSGNRVETSVNGGGIYNREGERPVGTWNDGTITMTRGAVVRNEAAQDGGGIWNGQVDTNALNAVNLDGTFVESNIAGRHGGGLLVTTGGTATVAASTIGGNTSGLLGGGIGLFGTATMAISDTDILDNRAPAGGADGGGISVQSGTLDLTRSLVDGNVAGREGGGLFARDGATVSVSDSILTNNSAGLGGAISGYEGRTSLEVLRSEISSNTATGGGGGIRTFRTNLRLEDTSVTLNTATAGGSDGGGVNVYNYYGDVGTQLVRTTIANNSAVDAGGGLLAYNGGTVNVLNSTISGNSAARGGAIYTFPSTSLTNVTLAGNSASSFEVLAREAGTLSVFNSIIEHDTADGVNPCSNNAITSSDYTVLEQGVNTDLCNLTGANDLIVPETLIKLDPTLADNGGPYGLKTHALLTGSLAIDIADSTLCDPNNPDTALDNRSAPRISGSSCDMGAFEYGSVPPIDSDGDGVFDLADNCPFTPNPDQADVGGIGSTLAALQPSRAGSDGLLASLGSAIQTAVTGLLLPATAHALATGDGIGDACQCGDVTDNGKVEINDATIIKRAILGLGPGLVAPLKCNVIGAADPGGPPEKPNDCEINDSTVVKRAILGLGPGVQQVCTPAVGGA